MLRCWISVLVVAVSAGLLGGPAAADLGKSAADLVFTPVTPCRIIDTRVMGGAVVPGSPRDFVVGGTQGFEAQGGHAGGCGIPDAATAAMLNFIAVAPQGPGDLRAWPFGQPVPLASIINYAAVAGLNLANGAVVTLCDPATATCTFDVSVQADGSAADLVVDVMGFFQSTAPRRVGLGGTGSTFLGVNAGNFAATGEQNTATGIGALQSNTSGALNTASGAFALQVNTTGSSNTATGHGALQNSNGSNNTAIGDQALQLSNGSNNTAIGSGALRNNATGSNNSALGTGADVSAGITNATAIGSGAIVNASNKIRLGNASVTVIEAQVGLTAVSDKTQKENFQPVDGDEVLRKLRGLSLTSWNVVGHDPQQFRHYGPMAQDFFAAFGHDGVGTVGTPTTINSGDLAGILMIAVQALERRTGEMRQETERLNETAAAFKAENTDLKARLESLERTLTGYAMKY